MMCDNGFRYGSIWKGCLTLYSGKGGDVHKVGEYVPQSLANMSTLCFKKKFTLLLFAITKSDVDRFQ